MAKRKACVKALGQRGPGLPSRTTGWNKFRRACETEVSSGQIPEGSEAWDGELSRGRGEPWRIPGRGRTGSDLALGKSPWPLDGETEAGRPELDQERISRAKRTVARSRSGGDQWDAFFSGAEGCSGD